jgi:hypothetical protein
MTIASPKHNTQVLDDLFPLGSRVLLTGTGRQFIERLGVEAVRSVVLGVLMGENIRTQTEPLTRQRIAQLSGAVVALFAQGWLSNPNFTNDLSAIALQQLGSRKKKDQASKWLANWMLGLTSKSVQNVLRSKPGQVGNYITDFEKAVAQAAEKCRIDLGDLRVTLGYTEDPVGRRVELEWQDVIRLTTAIGSLTLTIRGSDKSMFGKLFERLILGSFLTILGFERVDPTTNTKTANIFWLSDQSDLRESDATLLVRPGKVARFDIGFIGSGNSEISKDKLSRYARKLETAGVSHSSTTFIIVDRLPKTLKTQQAAEEIGAEIIQMSMQHWPRELAIKLGERFSFIHPLQTMPDDQIRSYLQSQLAPIRIQDFLNTLTLPELSTETNED